MHNWDVINCDMKKKEKEESLESRDGKGRKAKKVKWGRRVFMHSFCGRICEGIGVYWTLETSLCLSLLLRFLHKTSSNKTR